MPLIIPDDLSTRWILEADGVFLIDRAGAVRQDCRPLRVLVVDLDAGNSDAVDGLLGLLSLSPLQIEILIGSSGIALDGIVAWGSRIPDLPTGVPALLIGEVARTVLERDHRLPVEQLTHPIVEIVQHRVVGEGGGLVAAHDPLVDLPVARDWRIGIDALSRNPGLEVLSHAPRSGVHLVHEPAARRVHLLTQVGWSPLGFARHARHLAVGDLRDDDSLPPWTWRSHAHLVAASWLNLLVYQPASFPHAPAIPAPSGASLSGKR